MSSDAVVTVARLADALALRHATGEEKEEVVFVIAGRIVARTSSYKRQEGTVTMVVAALVRNLWHQGYTSAKLLRSSMDDVARCLSMRELFFGVKQDNSELSEVIEKRKGFKRHQERWKDVESYGEEAMYERLLVWTPNDKFAPIVSQAVMTSDGRLPLFSKGCGGINLTETMELILTNHVWNKT